MKMLSSFVLLLVPAALQAGEIPSFVPSRGALPPMLPEVARAPVRAEVTSWDQTTGGSLTIQLIQPPVLPQPAPPAAPLALLRTPEALAAWEARRKEKPQELRLFSASVTVYPENISLIRWWTTDVSSGFQEMEAFVAKDLGSIWSCGDLTVGNRRYLMMPTVFHATDRQIRERKSPALADFKSPDNIILTKGNRSNLKACEPLTALLDRYDLEGTVIAARDATRLTHARLQAEWEKQNPAPPPLTVIKIWQAATLETTRP